MALWDVALKLVTCTRFLRRLQRKRRAADLIKCVLWQVPLPYRLRNLYRQQCVAVVRLQRAWRSFSEDISTLVQGLLDGSWRSQEIFLLEAIFSACPTELEVVVNNVNMLTGTAEEDESSVYSSPESASTFPRRSRTSFGKLGLTMLPNSLLNDIPNATGRSETMPLGSTAQGARMGPRCTIVRPGDAIASSAFDALANKRKSISAMKAKSRGRDADLNHKELHQMLGGALQRRLQKRVQAHRFRRDVAARLLRRELVERLYEHQSQLEMARRQESAKAPHVSASSEDAIADSWNALWKSELEHDCDGSSATASCTVSMSRSVMEVGTASAATRMSAVEVADFVMCLHYGHGVRPARPEVSNLFYSGCQDWKVKAAGEMLAGSQTIREAVRFREMARQHPSAHRPGFASQHRQARAIRPSSAPAGRLNADLGAARREHTGHLEGEAASSRGRSSFDDCFAKAEAFCRNVLEYEPEEEAPESGDIPEDELGVRHLLPPGLAALEVGDLPGLHAAGMDLHSETKQALVSVASAPALQPVEGLLRRSASGRRGSIRRGSIGRGWR